MRILNLTVDDLYLLSKQVRSYKELGGHSVFYEMSLGKPVSKSLPNVVHLDGKDGWNVVQNRVLSAPRFDLIQNSGIPMIWDSGDSSMGGNLLFTGIYSFDVTSLLAEIVLYPSSGDLSGLKVIAGGYVPMGDTDGLSLLLEVPVSWLFSLNGVFFSCFDGTLIGKPDNLISLTMRDILFNLNIDGGHNSLCLTG